MMLWAASPSPFRSRSVFADGVGLGVDLRPVQVRGALLAVLGGELSQRLLVHGQHASGAARAVVQRVGAGADLVGDGQEDQL